MALSTQIASSSTPSPKPASFGWKHDVFLSFRGEDTRESFLSHLYHELQITKGIKTFKDDQQLEKGTAISQNLLTAIEESRFAIVVLSPNYASSTWCLAELTKIFQCMEGKDTILPIFYHVDPSDVRYQRGSFKVALNKHEKSGEDIEKVKQWRDALEKVAKISGWDSKNHKSERELVEDIVKFVWKKVFQAPIEIESEESNRGFEAFQATSQAMEKVMMALKDDKSTVIGVYGRGGVGKTTLVKHVGSQAKNDKLFDQVIVVVVSQSPDLKKIRGTMADLLGLNLENKTEVESGHEKAVKRAVRLKEGIMRANRTLIILDDIWKRIELSHIGIPSCYELQTCNSKVLLTTRKLNVCHSMESQTNIPLNILSEEDSLKLFVKIARKSSDKSNSFHDVARMVARECAGLPVVLIAVARALADKDLDDWQEAARRLKAANPADLEDKRDVFRCIRLSYDYLASDNIKSFLLLCCLFPEDSDIAIEDLLVYAIGKGLFQDADTIKEARAAAYSVAKYLQASGLLLESQCYGCVRIHNVIRDGGISISLSEDGPQFVVKAGCELKDWPTISAHEGYSGISLMKNEIQVLPKMLVCPKLQILLLQSNIHIRKIPQTFFQTPNELRVLDLRETSISLLPASFRLLTNLQALYIDDCKEITNISILRKLKKLEILSMRGIRLKELPKEVGELTNLKMLDVTNANFEIVPSQVLLKLHRLEELYMDGAFWNWGKGGLFSFALGSKNAGFDELTCLSRLNSLKVCVSHVECLPKDVRFNLNWVNFNITISRECRRREFFKSDTRQHPFRCVTVDTTMNTLPEWFINVVMEKAEILEYQWCMVDNLLVEYDSGKLHGLKYLSLICCDTSEVLMNPRTRVPNKLVFESLEHLHLESLSLKELCVGELPPGSLRNLKLLSVMYCRHLVNALIPSDLLYRLQNLERLRCGSMREMKYVFGLDGLEPEEIVLTKLREVILSDLEKLICIWNGPTPTGFFQNLRILAIRACHEIKVLFTCDVARCLLQLELLWIEKCSSLDRVIEPNNETEINKVVIPKLKDIYLSNLSRLTGFCSSTEGTATIDHIECPSLEHFYVFNCPQFSTSASDFHSKHQVQVEKGHFRFLLERLWQPRLPKEERFTY